MHYNYLNGEDWKDSQATYITTLSDGSKLWKAEINSYNTEHAIKYVAYGQVFWDNNNGNDYTTEKLGTAPITVNRSNSVYGFNYEIRRLFRIMLIRKM